MKVEGSSHADNKSVPALKERKNNAHTLLAHSYLRSQPGCPRARHGELTPRWPRVRELPHSMHPFILHKQASHISKSMHDAAPIICCRVRVPVPVGCGAGEEPTTVGSGLQCCCRSAGWCCSASRGRCWRSWWWSKAYPVAGVGPGRPEQVSGWTPTLDPKGVGRVGRCHEQQQRRRGAGHRRLPG